MEIINLDMTPSTVTPNAHAGQYDSARTVRFMLKNGGVPYTLAGTETITAEITRSDNTEVTVNVANTSSNYVDVVFDDTVCTVKGLYACELRLKDSDGFDIGSKNFALLVQRDPYDNKNIRIVTVGPADICTFETTLPEPYQSVIVNVLATGGNGTPDNPNPINGYSSANINANGITHTIAFGQTVYGGVLDVTRGKLTVTYEENKISTVVQTGTSSGGINYAQCGIFDNNRIKSNGDILCSIYKKTNTASENNAIRLVDKTIYIYDNRFTDTESAESLIIGIPIIYELATPFDIDLTHEVISAIVGTNNVFADCGQTTVKYLTVE